MSIYGDNIFSLNEEIDPEKEKEAKAKFRDEMNHKLRKEMHYRQFEDSIRYLNNDKKSVNEGFLSQLTMGAKIKPHQDLPETFKKHEYPGYLNYIKSCNKVEDLEYLRKDVTSALHTFRTIRDRIDKVNKYGVGLPETRAYYAAIKKKYIDKGITVKDCDATIKWFTDVVKPAITAKIKELKKG